MNLDHHAPIVSAGAFGQQVARLVAAKAANTGLAVGFYCASSLSLGGLAAFADGLPAACPVVGVFQFERFLLVSPRLGQRAGPCARCYGARLVSHPPHPLNDFVVRVASQMSDANPTFEYTGWSEGMARVAAALAWAQAMRRGTDPGRALAMDVANLAVLSDPLVALHGCRCRDAGADTPRRGTARFTAFVAPLRPILRTRASSIEEAMA